MKKVIFCLLMLIASFSYAQTAGTVSGKILDSEMYNEPLLMATVTIKNTDWTTQTNFNGNFEITDIPSGAYVLEISFLGYENVALPIEIKAGEKTEIYQSVKARSLPFNAVSTSTEKEISAMLPSEFLSQKLKK